MKVDQASPSGVRRIVVVGTGTGVGKTHLSCALLAAASAEGRQCIGLKPVESGISESGRTLDEDGARLHATSRSEMFHVKHPAPYRFVAPISPHLAARRAGVSIEVRKIRDYVDSAEGRGVVIVETAGGLFSPLGPGITNFEVVRALAPCQVVLVASDRLGVLHDLAATLGFARLRGCEVDVVALSAPDEPDSSTGTNADEASWLGIGEVAAVLPREAPESAASLRAAGLIWGALGH